MAGRAVQSSAAPSKEKPRSFRWTRASFTSALPACGRGCAYSGHRCGAMAILRTDQCPTPATKSRSKSMRHRVKERLTPARRRHLRGSGWANKVTVSLKPTGHDVLRGWLILSPGRRRPSRRGSFLANWRPHFTPRRHALMYQGQSAARINLRSPPARVV
jgi:hypothetical protein